jgi:hypothetical protein
MKAFKANHADALVDHAMRDHSTMHTPNKKSQ